eukprot:Colp12_sorted_trinity150504_noHs@9599
MGDFKTIGEQFVMFYYQTFDANRTGLVPLYQNDSMLTFEGEQFMGTESILKKLTSLSFTKVIHEVTKCDCQPSVGDSILIFVIGQLKVDDQAQPLGFSQVFNLKPFNGSWYVYNDIFRLNLH